MTEPEGGTGTGFEARQRAYFQAADALRFLWQTRHPYVAQRERALLPAAGAVGGGPFLEVGCGEGANLYHLTRDGAAAARRWVAVDLFFEKARHAARQLPGVRAVCARAERLPFADGRFAHVLSRDLLHHLPDQGQALAEARRVCAPGGTLTLLEPNGRNPIIWLFGLLQRAERGAMAMRPEAVLALLGPAARAARVEFLEPLPLHRIVFHYRYGLPRLGQFAWLRRGLAALEAWAGRVLPRHRWAYFRATIPVPPAPETAVPDPGDGPRMKCRPYVPFPGAPSQS